MISIQEGDQLKSIVVAHAYTLCRIQKFILPCMYVLACYRPSNFLEETFFHWYPPSLHTEQIIYTRLTKCCFHLNKQIEGVIGYRFHGQ